MTELERKIKAKIPGADTGIEVKKACAPSVLPAITAALTFM